jgi:hypothetical protein
MNQGCFSKISKMPYQFVLNGMVCLIIVSLLFQSCKCRREQSHAASGTINVSAKKEADFEINIQRFEKDLFAANIDDVSKSIDRLKAKYGEVFDIYNYKIISLGSSDDRRYPDALKRFLTDKYMNQDYERVLKLYPNLDDLNRGLTEAFLNFREYFPGKRIPKVYSCISGWNQSVVTSDTILVLALDKYLGRNCEFYGRLQLDHYMRYTMQKEYILPDCMRAWGYTTFEFKDSASNVLNNMLYEGKMVYFVSKMLPEAHDTLLLGFTPAQLKWCTNNSEPMWAYMVEHKLLFSSNNLLIRKFIYPAPFTSAFTQESPGRAIVWLGYRIVDAYMRNNKNVTLLHLMQDNDYQKILRMSNFKP